MTNQEKYKTTKERMMAFGLFCQSHDCKKCPCLDGRGLYNSCVSSWLGMEAEEEVLPCPFCGGKATPHNVFGVKPHVQCNACSVLMYGDTRTEVIAAWNRRVK